MNKVYVEGRKFDCVDFREKLPEKGAYENCTFSNCLLTTVDLSNISFSECVFDNCDLSMAILKDTSFRDVKFRNCKMLGLRFDDCNKFLLSLSFENCILNFASFYQLKIKNTLFKGCKIQDVEFVGTDLTNARFADCDLSRTIFQQTLLLNADLVTAYNYSIDPETNKLRKARFSVAGIAGLLDKYNIVIE